MSNGSHHGPPTSAPPRQPHHTPLPAPFLPPSLPPSSSTVIISPQISSNLVVSLAQTTKMLPTLRATSLRAVRSAVSTPSILALVTTKSPTAGGNRTPH